MTWTSSSEFQFRLGFQYIIWGYLMQYNNIGISGTHFILRIQYKYTQTQYKGGARYVNIILLPKITCSCDWHIRRSFFAKVCQIHFSRMKRRNLFCTFKWGFWLIFSNCHHRIHFKVKPYCHQPCCWWPIDEFYIRISRQWFLQ